MSTTEEKQAQYTCETIVGAIGLERAAFLRHIRGIVIGGDYEPRTWWDETCRMCPIGLALYPYYAPILAWNGPTTLAGQRARYFCDNRVPSFGDVIDALFGEQWRDDFIFAIDDGNPDDAILLIDQKLAEIGAVPC